MSRCTEFFRLSTRLCPPVAQASHVGTWYEAGGRLSLEQVAAVQVGLALRMVAAKPVAATDVARLVRDVRTIHERRP